MSNLQDVTQGGELNKCTGQWPNGFFTLWDTCSNTTVTQCSANASWLRCARVPECMRVRQKCYPTPWRLGFEAYLSFLSPQSRNIEAQFHKFKTLRKQEVQEWLNDLCSFCQYVKGHEHKYQCGTFHLTNVATPRSKLVCLWHHAISAG